MPPTTSTAKEAKLVCTECRRENEAERIFCHECGARLDRSRLAKPKGKAGEEAHETHRRVKAMFDPARGQMRQNFFLASKLLLGALCVAAVVQIFRVPDLPPAPTGDVASMPPPIIIDMENAALTANVPVLRYSDEQVNAFLAYALKSKQSTLSKYVKFDRLALSFDEGVCRATVQRSFSGVPLCTSTYYAPSLDNGNLVMKNCGGQLGRLPIHPALMKYCDFLFADLRSTLERERKSIAKMGALELHPKQVVFVPKPKT